MATDTVVNLVLLPRLIRLRDVPAYLGMDRNRFNSEVRPNLTEIPIGEQGIAFDRFELDAWVDEYKSANGRPGKPRGTHKWGARERRGSSSGPMSGTSTNASADGEFAKALARVTSKRQNATSRG